MPATPLSFSSPCLPCFLFLPLLLSTPAMQAREREQWVGRTRLLPSPPLHHSQASWGNPHPIWRGVSRTPPHDLITGSRGAGMASGCMAPECTLGKGAAQKCAVWHDVAAGERGADFPSRALVEAGGISGSQARQAPPLGLRRPQRGQKQKGN